MSSSPQESASDLWLEHSNFLSCAIGAIAYGIYVALYFFTTYRMIKTRKQYARTAYYLVFNFLFFVVTTVNVAANIRWNMITFIDHRNYPGGPLAYALLEVREEIIVAAMFILGTFLADLLMLYRCYIIWQDNKAVIAIPALMFLASTILSILFVYQVSRPSATFWTHKTVNLVLPYWALTISMNILVTLLISGRLFALRKSVGEALGEGYAKKYTSAIAMIVESAALYTVNSLLCLITYAAKSYAQNLFLALSAVIMPSTSLLIFLRIASGKGFTRERSEEIKMSTISKMKFATKSSSTTVSDDSLAQTRVFENPV